MKHRAAPFGLFIVLVLGIMLSGCSSPSIPDRERVGVEGGFLERTTPESVLANLRVLYGTMDNVVRSPGDAHYWAERYRGLFHPDTYVFKFYFLPEDIPPGFPQGWWGVENEVRCFEGLLVGLASGQVADIRLDWTLNPSEPDNRVDPDTGELLHPEWRWIHAGSIFLDVDLGHMIFRVSDGLADFYFSPDPTDSTLWVLAEWFDRGVLSSADRTSRSAFRHVVNRSNAWDVTAAVTVEPTTWGRIKSLYM